MPVKTAKYPPKDNTGGMTKTVALCRPGLPAEARSAREGFFAQKRWAHFSLSSAAERKFALFSALILTLAALILYSKAAVVVPTFITIAALSRYLQKAFPFVVGIDLCLFFTVIAALAYGSTAGAIVGIGAELLGIVVKNTRNPGEKISFYAGMGIIGVIAPHLPFQSTYATGIFATAVYDMIVVFGYFYLVRKCALNAFTFVSTHLVFNIWLFATFGEGLLSLIS